MCKSLRDKFAPGSPGRSSCASTFAQMGGISVAKPLRPHQSSAAGKTVPVLSLRPATPSDETLLLRWRNDANARAMSLSPREISLDEHRKWLSVALARGNPSVVIVQHQARDCGVVRVHLNPSNFSEGNWSCQVGDLQVPLGFGATLPLVAIAWGFGELGLKRMRAEVLNINKNMLAIHKRLGIVSIEDHMSTNQSTIRKFVVSVHEAPAILHRGSALLPKRYRLPPEIVSAALRRAKSEETT